MSAESTNIVEYWHNQVRKYGDRPAYRIKKDGKWNEHSWTEYGRKVKEFAIGLLALGAKPGDCIAILASTREEWDLADRAALAVGGIGVGVYHSNTAEQVQYILDHSESKILIVEDQTQWDKIEEIRSQLTEVRRFVIMDPLSDMSDSALMSFKEVMELGQAQEDQLLEEYWNRGKNIKASDAAICVYTSGTTGPPKGAILTHRNIMTTLQSFRDMGIFVPEEDRTVVWLPLPHVFGRFVVLSGVHNAHIWSYAGTIETLIEDLADIRPTVFHSVPRIYEKLYNKILSSVEHASPLKKGIFHLCMETGKQVSQYRQQKKPIPLVLRARYALADRLLYGKVKEMFGGRLNFAVTGGAPLSKEILEFFHAAGVLILEGYGLTESPVAAFNQQHKFKFGTVGPPTPVTEIKIADNGEILLRAPIVFSGYLKAPDKTKEAFTDDGWYRTGDIGVLSPDGFLVITDRIKDLIITAGGKNVAPQNIENLLKTSPLVSQAMVYGDRKPYLVAVITLDPEEIDSWAKANNVPEPEAAALYQDPRIKRLVADIVEEKNQHLARFETIKKFTILPNDLTQEAGELTPTLKLKRRFVSEKYKDILEGMYE